MVSIKDIAKAVGVSPSAVSFVLNGKAKEKRISTELADRIVATARHMGYHPNRVAVGLRTGKSKTIGLIVENISNHFFSCLARTIEDEARQSGYNIVYCSTENDTVKGREMIQMLNNYQVDGYLITPVIGMEEDIQKLLRKNKPVVLMDRYFEGLDVPFVVVDNYEGMRSGVDYLVRSGYRQIGFVTVDIDLIQIHERKRAFRDSHLEHGLPCIDSHILTLPYKDNKNQSVAAISQFLKQQTPLEVVVFATNYLGIYGLQSIKKLGLQIPRDIRMICFDDHDIFELYSPGITAIRQPIIEIARTAINLLIGQMDHYNNSNPARVLLQTEIIFRASA